MGIAGVSFTALAAPNWSNKVQFINPSTNIKWGLWTASGEKHFGCLHSSPKEV